MDAATSWGTTPRERERTFGCDDYLADARTVCWRGVDVHAPAATVFRRLCQLRVAPYSYDWIDNLGRRSPQELTAGLEHLALGQRFMSIFELVAFTPDREITLRTRSRSPFGDVAVSYAVEPRGDDGCRLLAKLRWRISGLPGRLLVRPAAWADLVMMRRQFLNLKGLAESDDRRAVASVPRDRTSLLPPPASPAVRR